MLHFIFLDLGSLILALFFVCFAEGDQGIGLFPGDSVSEDTAFNAGDPGLIPGLGRSPGEGNDNTFQYAWEIPSIEEPGGP